MTTAMKERPIIFSAPMVRAILEGRKTQTRRIVSPKHLPFIDRVLDNFISGKWGQRPLPYGKSGDRLWVRESHAIVPRTAYAQSNGVQQTLHPENNHDAAIYRCGWERSEGGIHWRPSIHMPRWARRINLEITGVRIEQLKDIHDNDAIAEGAQKFDKLPAIHPYGLDCRWSMETPISTDQCLGSARLAFANYWNKINGDHAWTQNPWVWVIEFNRVDQ